MKKKTINGLILAAGISSRMGEFKPLLPLLGKTVIENSIDSMLLAGVSQIVVVLGYRGKELERFLNSRYLGNTIKLAYNPDYAVSDMLASARIGVEAMPPCDAFFLLPGDMPTVSKETYLALYRNLPETGAGIVFPTQSGYRKHPPLIDYRYRPAIRSCYKEGGLRELWKEYENAIITVNVDDEGCWTDLDTFEQYICCLKRYPDKKHGYVVGL